VPGHFAIPFKPEENVTFCVIASTDEIDSVNGEELLQKRKDRISRIVKQAGYNDHLVRRLVRAADSFIVQRQSTGKKTVIAGYHWFADWGRDTMIPYPALPLSPIASRSARDPDHIRPPM